MATEIRTLQEELVYCDPKGNPWLKLYFDYVEFPNGDHGRYNKVVEGTGDPGVAVLPVSDHGIGLVRQHRYAIGEHVWEIPRGYGDSANPSHEAQRELFEETGLHAEELVALGCVHPNSAILATRVELFAARCGTEPSRAASNGRELVEFKWFSISETMAAARNGTITDAFTLAALLRAQLAGLVAFP